MNGRMLLVSRVAIVCKRGKSDRNLAVCEFGISLGGAIGKRGFRTNSNGRLWNSAVCHLSLNGCYCKALWVNLYPVFRFRALKYRLEAPMSVLSLSMTIPLVPPGTLEVTSVLLPVRDTTQPAAGPTPVQSEVSEKRKKSVPPIPIFGLKNSVHDVQRAVAEVRSCCEKVAVVFMLRPVNPKEYCHGVVSAAPVPQVRICPVDGSL